MTILPGVGLAKVPGLAAACELLLLLVADDAPPIGCHTVWPWLGALSGTDWAFATVAPLPGPSAATPASNSFRMRCASLSISSANAQMGDLPRNCRDRTMTIT